MSYSLVLPEYDQEKFAAKYSELGTHVISIPPNMDALGYDGINKLFSDIQHHIDAVSDKLAEATHLESVAKAVREASKAAYEAKYAALISSKSASDKQYSSFKILESEVVTELAEDKKLMDRAKIASGLFGAYRQVVEGKLKNLESARNTLELQNNNYKRIHPPVQAYGK